MKIIGSQLIAIKAYEVKSFNKISGGELGGKILVYLTAKDPGKSFVFEEKDPEILTLSDLSL